MEWGGNQSSNNQDLPTVNTATMAVGSMVGNDQAATLGASVTVDDFLFTPYQRYILKMTPWYLHFILGCIASLIGFVGIVANCIVLLIFSRYRRLRSCANIFVMNLAVGDLLAALLHPLAAYSCFNGGWSFGAIGCNIYGSTVALCGFNSIVTLTMIACERYQVIANQTLIRSKWNISKKTAFKICVAIWIYCLLLVLPPFFGASRYQPDGLLVTCSWDYTTKTLVNRIYYIYLVIFGFFIPVIIIIFCYSVVYIRVISHDKEMVTLASNSASQKAKFSKLRRKLDIQTAQIIGTLILLVITAWTPYTVVSFIGQFGEEGTLTPLAASLPAFFAKGACVFDPLVYALSHPRFRLSMEHFFSQLWFQWKNLRCVIFLTGGGPANTDELRVSLRSNRKRLAGEATLEGQRPMVTFTDSTPPQYDPADSRTSDTNEPTGSTRITTCSSIRLRQSNRALSWPGLSESRISSRSTPNLSTDV